MCTTIWTSCKYFGLLNRFYCTGRISLSISLFFQRKNCHWYKQRYKKLLNTANQWSSNGPVFRSVNPALFRARNFLGDLCLYHFTWNLFLELRGQVWDHSYYLVPSEPRPRDSEQDGKLGTPGLQLSIFSLCFSLSATFKRILLKESKWWKISNLF